MKSKEIEAKCASCGAPLMVARREEWKSKVILELHPCVHCMEKRWQAGAQQAGEPR
jgi:ssDNA-binding Zn-finger/Zn-ribbon topoisomerase 1